MSATINPYPLIAASLSGNISVTDQLLLDDWLAKSEANQDIFLESKRIWESASVSMDLNKTDSSHLLVNIQTSIREESQPPANIISIVSSKSRYWQVAACIIMMLVTYFLIRLLLNDRIIINTQNKVAVISLPDNSKVWLNANSSLSYSKKFRDRTVDLKGEGFFSVIKGKGTFTVTTKNSNTQVLGTAFNLKEEADSAVTLAVSEGAVNFNYRNLPGEKVLINGGEKAILTRSEIVKSKNADASVAAWRFDRNQLFKSEKISPTKYLSNKYSWRKNDINQSVITGTIMNHATLCAYKKILLSLTFTKPDGTRKNIEFLLPDTIYPGQQLKYRKGLFDILTNTKSIVVSIKSAEPIAL